jgi:hypothetical protein
MKQDCQPIAMGRVQSNIQINHLLLQQYALGCGF